MKLTQMVGLQYLVKAAGPSAADDGKPCCKLSALVYALGESIKKSDVAAVACSFRHTKF